MSRIGDVRTALATVLDAVTGIDQMLPYPPASIDVEGTAWLDFFDDAVVFSQSEQHIYTVPLTVCVTLNADHAAGMKATEPIIDAVLAVLRINQGLGLVAVNRVEVTRITQGVWKVGDTPFIGFQITLVIKEVFGAAKRENP